MCSSKMCLFKETACTEDWRNACLTNIHKYSDIHKKINIVMGCFKVIDLQIAIAVFEWKQ